MARSDIHLDAMLRHLGAAYYEATQGRATRADVTRALDTVAERETLARAQRACRSPPEAGRPAAVHPSVGAPRR